MLSFNTMDNLSQSPSLGYWLIPSAQGAGVISIDVEALLRYAQKTQTIKQVILRCATHNLKSQRVETRLGFEKIAFLENQEKIGDKRYDQFEYRNFFQAASLVQFPLQNTFFRFTKSEMWIKAFRFSESF